ncbi:MAG TPA: ABC transporter ATP-binding protein [Candidatus Deferrimicrobiaceae bacterium]|jgi:cobalt/nickel transport system ATP-binding protein|nr:ABC transporter ATP-binding protein [Candidatus Deferrimicrobiaceae bacterium]
MTMTAHSGQTVPPLLELADIHYAYREGIPALSGLSLSVYPAERIAVLGANGCGKSTLLKLLGGLIFPQSGSYRAFGRQIDDRLLSRDPFGIYFRKEVGILFQNSDAQLFNPTVEDEIAFGPLQMNDPPEEIRSKVHRTIEMFGIGAIRDRAPYELSGGEKKKVAIASMMVMDPQILLLDEPTAGLDPRSSRALVDAIIEAEESGKTVVTATHDLHVVSEIARRVLVFGEDRRILASGTPEEILSDRSLLLAANLVHLHRHAHEDYWHAHEHEHPEVFHVHEHRDGSPRGEKEGR